MYSAFVADLLLEVDILISSNLEECGMHVGDITENKCSSVDQTALTDVHVCFVFLKGDYGGPLMCYGDSGFKQVGIMSYGSQCGCALPGQPGVYTQVSKYLSYINYYIHL